MLLNIYLRRTELTCSPTTLFILSLIGVDVFKENEQAQDNVIPEPQNPFSSIFSLLINRQDLLQVSFLTITQRPTPYDKAKG